MSKMAIRARPAKSCITAICTQMSFHKMKNCGQTFDITKQRPKNHLKTLKNAGEKIFV